MKGPKLKLEATCFDCAHCKSTRYVCQGDSGYANHCEAAGQAIGISWRTPDWCPYLTEAKRDFAERLADGTGKREPTPSADISRMLRALGLDAQKDKPE